MFGKYLINKYFHATTSLHFKHKCSSLFKTSIRSASDKVDTSKITIEKTTNPKNKPQYEKLLFGKEFTDHMLEIDWEVNSGWKVPRISPFHNISLHPAASVFHYASEIFEGMKAYKDSKGKTRLFRPDKNHERFTKSAQRLALPTMDYNGFLNSLKSLLKTDEEWIPSKRGFSLYIRPTLIGTLPQLGVAPSSIAKYFVICSPVGPYYPEGWKPVKLLATDEFVRAWPGGTGEAKAGGNYAIGIMPQMEAAKRGYTQILWLFGQNHQVTEVGTMNFFIFWKNKQGKKELITAPLDGTILPGVTRDSVLSLARQWNEFEVSETSFTIGDIIEALKEDRLLEAFGAGTAAVVSPVKTIAYKGVDYNIPLDKRDKNASIGPLAKRFADTIMGIQYGEINHSWSVVVD